MKKLPLILVLNDVRSAHNVGAIWRTADGAGIEQIFTVGITPHPALPEDPRLPHVAGRADKAISKTALGAEKTLPFQHFLDLHQALAELRRLHFRVFALEQHPSSVSLFDYQPSFPMALVLGPEVEGLNPSQLELCDEVLQIPQYGLKESLNVAVAAGVAAYFLRYYFDRS
jgi:23S rRNA (guanosine2251-2'-O)-methyltransferase